MPRNEFILSRRRLLTAGSGAVAAAFLAACNANGTGSSPSTSGSAKAVTGGTLHLLTTAQEVNYDPAVSSSLGISTIHLLHRSLTTWDTSGGGVPKVIPDLATDTGTPSENGKVWTYTLRPGLKFSDGQEITATHVKYGIERSFAAELSGGLSYHKTLLAGGSDYHGPYTGGSLASIETPDDHTIVFRLNRSFGDWPWIVSMPAFAPVPKSADTHPATYGTNPVSSGPYALTSYEKNKRAVLTRNKYWVSETAAPGTGRADQVVLELSLNADIVNERLITQSGDDQYAFTNGVTLPASLLPKVNANPDAKARLAVSPSGALKYLAINTARPALKDLNVRKAITYAIDKTAFQVASGGPEIGGDIATTLIEPGLNGYQKYDPWGVPASGSADKAKALLEQAGVSGLKLTLLVDGDGSGVDQQAQAIQESLRKAGITVTIKSLESNAYSDAITNDKGDYDLTITSWLADYPSAAAAIQPLFHSSQIGGGNYNVSRYSDPAVDQLIDAALGETDETKSAAQWAAIDKRVQQDAPGVPLLYNKNAFLHGSKVAGFAIGTFPPYPNVLTLGVAG
jgi:peptide/nickel transport system substrate-binding protein